MEHLSVERTEYRLLRVKRCSLLSAGLLVSFLVLFLLTAAVWATEAPAVEIWPMVQAEVGASQSYLALVETVVRVTERDGLFLLQEPAGLNRTTRLAEHHTFTVLEPDDEGNVMLRVEVRPLDPDMLLPYVAPAWTGVYALARGEARARLVEGTASSLIGPDWLLWGHKDEGNAYAAMQPGEVRPVVLDAAGLRLPRLPDNAELAEEMALVNSSIEFSGWESDEGADTAAAMFQLKADVEAETTVDDLRTMVTGERALSVRLVPGDFPLDYAAELLATVNAEVSGGEGSGLTGSLTMEVRSTVSVTRTDPMAVPEVEPLQAGDLFGGLLEGDGWVLDDGTQAALFALNGMEGEVVRLVLESPDFDAYLMLLDDEWQVLAEDDDSAGGTDAEVQIRLPRTGSYVVVANAYAADMAGRFTLTVESLGREVDPEAMRFLLAQGWEQIEAAMAAADWDGIADTLEELLWRTREKLPLQIAEAMLIVERAFDYGEYIPRASRVYRPGDWVHIYLEPENFHTRREAGRYEIHLTVDATLVDRSGNVVSHMPGVVVWNRITHRPVQDVALSVPLWLGDVESGNYTWRLTVRDMVSGESATAEVPIVISRQASTTGGFS